MIARFSFVFQCSQHAVHTWNSLKTDLNHFCMLFCYSILSQISKSNVVDDMVESNRILYEKGEKPDHCVVIKYVPYVGDSKRAMDEYTSEIFMHGLNTIVLHNTCEVCMHLEMPPFKIK